jgi:hypothetical protein
MIVPSRDMEKPANAPLFLLSPDGVFRWHAVNSHSNGLKGQVNYRATRSRALAGTRKIGPGANDRTRRGRGAGKWGKSVERGLRCSQIVEEESSSATACPERDLMMCVLYAVLSAVCWTDLATGLATCGSFLYRPAYCLDNELRGPAEAYLPQPGDIMLRMDGSKFWRITHYMALAFDPNGSGIVFARPDGSLAVLEAGPNDTMWVQTLDLLPHLMEYAAEGKVWIRKRCVPLTAEQSTQLTAFALRQDGKLFALQRLGVQLTPFRTRGPIRTCFIGRPHGDRLSYFCSELVCEACVAAGLLDPERTRPSATYPHDLFFGRSYNLFINSHLDVNANWEPPARWTDHP